jgi:hypothetical protein
MSRVRPLKPRILLLDKVLYGAWYNSDVGIAGCLGLLTCIWIHSNSIHSIFLKLIYSLKIKWIHSLPNLATLLARGFASAATLDRARCLLPGIR